VFGREERKKIEIEKEIGEEKRKGRPFNSSEFIPFVITN
jgi:hypothetical protein